MAEVHVEILRFGQPLPEGGFLIPLPRKSDGTPEPMLNFEAIGKAIAAAQEQGYTRIFIEAVPHA
jgi:hypothetical protein